MSLVCEISISRFAGVDRWLCVGSVAHFRLSN